jgi:hypothetical protein
MWSWFGSWSGSAPIPVIGGVVLVLMAVAAVIGSRLRRWRDSRHTDAVEWGREAPTITAVMTLLALLLGFSFNLAIERFEQRRQLVVEEANAIGVAYLRAQLLPQPHRKRIGDLLLAYTDNRLALATIGAKREPALLTRNDAIITDLWGATSAALESINRPDFSNAFLTSMNNLIDLDAARKNARLIHMPSEITIIMFSYMIITSGLLGYLEIGAPGKISAIIVLVMMAMFLLLVVDIDRPMQGAIRESQAPMELLRATLTARPPSVFDRYKAPTPDPPASANIGAH